MVLVLALASTTERLIRFETCRRDQVRRGRGACSHSLRMARLYGLGLMLDLITASVAAIITILAALCQARVRLAQHPPEASAIYAIAMVCNITGAPGAALRLAGQSVPSPHPDSDECRPRATCRPLSRARGGLLGYIAAWTIAEVGYRLATLWLGFALHRQRDSQPGVVRLTGLLKDFPGFLLSHGRSNLPPCFAR